MDQFLSLLFRYPALIMEKINRVIVSYNDPLEIYKNRINSFFEYLPLPSAMFKTTGVLAASSCSMMR